MAPRTTQTVKSILKGHNLDSSINSYLKILAPLQCTLETCSGIEDDDFGNILMVSPSTTYIYPCTAEQISGSLMHKYLICMTFLNCSSYLMVRSATQLSTVNPYFIAEAAAFSIEILFTKRSSSQVRPFSLLAFLRN